MAESYAEEYARYQDQLDQQQHIKELGEQKISQVHAKGLELVEGAVGPEFLGLMHLAHSTAAGKAFVQAVKDKFSSSSEDAADAAGDAADEGGGMLSKFASNVSDLADTVSTNVTELARSGLQKVFNGARVPRGNVPPEEGTDAADVDDLGGDLLDQGENVMGGAISRARQVFRNSAEAEQPEAEELPGELAETSFDDVVPQTISAGAPEALPAAAEGVEQMTKVVPEVTEAATDAEDVTEGVSTAAKVSGFVAGDEETGGILDAIGLPEVGLIVGAVGGLAALGEGLKDVFEHHHKSKQPPPQLSIPAFMPGLE